MSWNDYKPAFGLFSEIKHNRRTYRLTVTFRETGAVYAYDDVKPYDYKCLRVTVNKGAFFSKYIKGRHVCVRLKKGKRVRKATNQLTISGTKEVA